MQREAAGWSGGEQRRRSAGRWEQLARLTLVDLGPVGPGDPVGREQSHLPEGARE